MLLGDPGAKLSLVGTSSAPAPLLKRMQHLLDRCGSFYSQDRPTMKEVTPQVEALQREASTCRGHHRGTEKGAAIPAARAAPVPAVAEAATTAEPAVDHDSWPGNNTLETPKADLWSPQMFSVAQSQHDSVATVAAQSPAGYQTCDDERLSVSGTVGVGGSEGIAAEGTAAAPTAIAAPAAAAEATIESSGSWPQRVQGTPKAVPWSPQWLSEGRRTPSTATAGGGSDGGGGSCDERVVLGAETAELGAMTAVALAAATEATESISPWKPDSAYSIMTTSDSGFQRRYVTKPDGEKPSGNKANESLGLFVAGVAGVARNSDGNTEEQDPTEAASDAEHGSANAHGRCEEGEEREGSPVAAEAAGAGERIEPRSAPRAANEAGKEEDCLVAQAVRDMQMQAGGKEQGRMGRGNVSKNEEEEGEEDNGEDEDEEDLEGERKEEEEGDKHIQCPWIPPGSTLSRGANDNNSGTTMMTFATKDTSRRRQHDRSVLMALFERCRGPLWPHSDNWGSEEPLSTWYNVDVDGWGHIAALVLSRNKLSGEIARSVTSGTPAKA